MAARRDSARRVRGHRHPCMSQGAATLGLRLPDARPKGHPALDRAGGRPRGVTRQQRTEQILLPESDVATSNQRSCSKCTEETLTRVAFDLTKELLEEASAGTRRTRLRILSTPPGAWITLDTTNVGLTDHTYSTFPGRHVVTVQRDGYQIETRTVDVIENKETTVAITLRANDKVTPAPTAGEHPHLIPAVVIGAGAAALVVGVVLQLPPDSGRQPKYLVNAPGAICVIGGGLAVGLGVYLWIRATKNAAPVSMPTGAITAGGGIVGWMGHF